MNKLYSTVDLSRLLGIQEHRITYAIRAGFVPEPSYKVANKRVFTQEDLRRVAEHFGVEPPSESEAVGRGKGEK